MIINHNIASLNTLNKLTYNNNNVSKSLSKLSSGLRINSAADDAAGLAISEKMRGQINGLEQASSNAQDGISMIQTAEGALNETHSILQRMRELAVQSATDTNTDDDRKSIQSEMTQLESEIDRIGNTTQFNTKNLIDGSMGNKVDTAAANVNTSEILQSGGAAITASSTLVDLTDANGSSLGIASGDTINISYVSDGTTHTQSVSVSGGTTLTNLFSGTVSGTLSVTTSGNMEITASGAGLAGAVNGLTVTVKDSDGNARTAATNALSSFTETTAAADAHSTDGRATIQIGANTNQNLVMDFQDMRAAALGVNGLQVTSQNDANVAIKVIDTATAKVSEQRANMGALQNRLEHTINNLTTADENLTSAESRIRDVDMAKEMTNYTKYSILSQAATAMLAQANQQPQNVLSLLK